MRCSSSVLAWASILANLSEGAEASVSSQLRRSHAEAEAEQCLCSQDTDYAGGDLGWLKVGSVAECCSACRALTRCAVSVFLGNRCYLKNSTVPMSASSHHIACRPQAGKKRPDHLKGSSGETTRVVKPASCSRYGCVGSFAPSWSCQCNQGCRAHGDCCYDYAELCSSSARMVKGNSNLSFRVNTVSCAAYGCNYHAGSLCQCNLKCREYDNCCDDYEATCLAGNNDVRAGESFTTWKPSFKTVPKASEVTAAKLTAVTSTATLTVVAMLPETTGKITQATKAVWTTTAGTSDVGLMPDTTASNSIESTSSQTDSKHTRDATEASIGKAGHQSFSGCHTVSGRHLLSCSSEKGKDSHWGRKSVVVMKKFLQSLPHLDKGRKAFYNTLSGIALLAAVTLFTLVSARLRLCRTREHEDVEVEKLLETAGDVCQEQSDGISLVQRHD